MIAIVCGGRDYADAARVKQILDAAVDRLGLHTVIEGGAKGADRLAYEWAEKRGDVSVIEVPADWSKGRGAGHARNSIMLAMLQRSDDDKAVIAFRGGDGTANMVKIAGWAGSGIRIIEVDKMPRVLNRHHGKPPAAAIYVGRGTPYGNPFEIGRDGDRDVVCDRFEREVLPTISAELIEALRGKDLVCSCAPARCHADALLRAANK